MVSQEQPSQLTMRMHMIFFEKKQIDLHDVENRNKQSGLEIGSGFRTTKPSIHTCSQRSLSTFYSLVSFNLISFSLEMSTTTKSEHFLV